MAVDGACSGSNAREEGSRPDTRLGLSLRGRKGRRVALDTIGGRVKRELFFSLSMFQR
jgi:hypothetical protein